MAPGRDVKDNLIFVSYYWQFWPQQTITAPWGKREIPYAANFSSDKPLLSFSEGARK